MNLLPRFKTGFIFALLAVAQPLSARPPEGGGASLPPLPPAPRVEAAPPPEGPPEPAAPPGFVYWKTVKARVTAYDPGGCCCERIPDGMTSTGDNAWLLDGAAVAPLAIPYRTRLWIPGAGWREADDTGSAMRQAWRKGIHHVDLRMATHWQARQWGVQKLEVRLYRPADRAAP